MSLSEPERGTGSASNLPPSAERATSMPVARARRYVLAILRGRGRRPRPVGRACAGALAPGVALTGGCLAGKKPQDASESFIFRIIHPQQYPIHAVTHRVHRCTGAVHVDCRGAGGGGTGYGPYGLSSYVSLPAPTWSGRRPVRSRLSGQTHPQTSRSAPAHSQYPGARAPEGLGRTADRTLTPRSHAPGERRGRLCHRLDEDVGVAFGLEITHTDARAEQ